MFGDPLDENLERWELVARAAEKAARREGKVPFWKRPAVVVAGIALVFGAAAVRGALVEPAPPRPAAHLALQTAGFDGGGLVAGGAFTHRSRHARRSQFSRLVLRTPDAAAWPELEAERRAEGQALVRAMLGVPFDGTWKHLGRGLRRELDGVAAAGVWERLELHWSHSGSGNAATLRAYHENVRGVPGGMAYHFVIGNGRGAGDGEISVGPRWKSGLPSGAPVAPGTVSVCLVGEGEPTAAQESALRELAIYLEAKVGELVAR